MDFIKEIKDNSILIIDNNIKNKVLDYIDKNKILKNIKIINFQELKKSLYFDYTNETIFRIMNHYHLKYAVAKKYLDNIYYIIDEVKDNDKYKMLMDIKKYCDDENLLIYDKLFPQLLENHEHIYIYGFNFIESFNKHMLDKLKNVIIIDNEKTPYKHDVYAFKNINEEITFVAENISKLITNNVDVNKIYIANYDPAYYFTIDRIFKSYNIPFYIKNESTLYDTAIGSYVLENLDKSFYSILGCIKQKYNIDNNIYNMEIYQKVKSLFDKYYWCSDENIQELIEEEMKKIKLPYKHQEKEVVFTNIINNYFADDEYVFLINFNQGNIPKFKKDTDFISDDIKPSYISLTNEYNKNIKIATLKAIHNIKNLTITFKTNDENGECYPSSLIDDDHINKLNGNKVISHYSNLNNKIMYANALDKLIKFNEEDECLKILNNNYDIPYNTYNHQYQKIDKDLLIKNIDNKLNFSYSNIQKYYECPFKFYLTSILKIDEFNDTFDTFIGSIFHHTLEKHFKTNEDPNKIYDEYVLEYNKQEQKIEFNYMNNYYIKLLKKEIIFIIDIIKEQYKHLSITNQEFEVSKFIDIDKPFKTKIKGFVDKIIYMDDKALIIDYKTGKSDKIDNDLFAFGLNLQLPIYLYLLDSLDKNIKVQGIYLQHIIGKQKGFSIKDNKDEKEKDLKLDGITFGTLKSLSETMDDVENSNVIKGLKFVKKNGDLNYGNRLFTEDKTEKLVALVKEKIDNCIDDVSNSRFEIRPIKIDKKCDGCKYCKFKDICFKSENDYRIEYIKGDDEICQD